MTSNPKATQAQTTKVNGKRVRIITRGGKVTIKQAPALEWELQAEQCRRLKAMPEYGKQFLLVGGMEAGRRGRQEQIKAKATGLTAGHPDLTVFLPGGKVAMIENKAENGRLSMEQKERHTALAAIGHTVEVVKASTADEAASMAVALVRGWLADNDNAVAAAP
ncbi:VRR-NUC domain-containing protein [Shinella zoogloeoides]|uniref:VRR-NUC domain-containing protein n=1 Tax=Shinella zoogloeoides TaxID=352475 RepID=UPI001F5AD974|nr:VRR-NUC domain-containing protein [Shinella zoogloeoides]